jgi:hypothetical protein
VGIVHGLESNAGIIAVEVTVLDEILDGIDNLTSVNIGFLSMVETCTFFN